MLTFRDLLNQLQSLPVEKLDLSVTVYDRNQDEFYPVQKVSFSEDTDDILDGGHPILLINGENIEPINVCTKCGQHFSNHNDDGSCVED